MMALVAGVDGARIGSTPGWALVLAEDRRVTAIEFVATFAAVLERARDAAAVAVDIPIGHDDPTGAVRGGRRAADLEARAALGDRAGSVFLIPPLDLFDLADHAAATLEARRRGLIAPSAQAWGLRDPIREVNAVAHAGDALREVHPELSFRALATEVGRAGAPQHSKTTPAGIAERLELLHAVGLRPARSTGGIGRLSPDDVLDATVAVWTAGRIVDGSAVPTPAVAPTDPRTGRPAAIWA